ncbi:MAG: response regulator transcription factor [Spirochaetaceae bacterium]|nr:MAG: response regulator transcription factor [Spirochaetaceae bacterium]
MIQVGILGDNTMIQAGLRSLLQNAPDLEVVELSNLGNCDILVLCGTPGLGDSDLGERPLTESAPALLVISDEIEPFRSLLEALDDKFGLLSEDASGEEIIAAIRALFSGLLAGSPRLMRSFFSGEQIRGGGFNSVQELSPRETEVLQLLSLGLLNKEIAARLGISEHTVKYHISSIFSKLDVANRVEAVRAGIRWGLLNL